MTIDTINSAAITSALTLNRGSTLQFGEVSSSDNGFNIITYKDGKGFSINARGSYLNFSDSTIEYVDRNWQAGAGTTCCISTSGKLCRLSSSIRFKTEIDYDLDREEYHKELMSLKPCTYEYKEERYLPNLGLIAEDVYDVNPDLVNFNEDFEVDSFKDRDIMTLLIIEAQRKDKEIAALQEEVQNLKQEGDNKWQNNT